MTSITFPTNTTEIIDDIRDLIGREITINVTTSGTPCPTCDLDPVTGLAVDQFCLTCSGFYWINTISGLTLQARVLYKGVDTPIWVVGGRIVEGDAQVRVKYTDTNILAVESAESYLVDEKRYLMKSFELRGVPDVNRIVVTLEQVDD